MWNYGILYVLCCEEMENIFIMYSFIRKLLLFGLTKAENKYALKFMHNRKLFLCVEPRGQLYVPRASKILVCYVALKNQNSFKYSVDLCIFRHPYLKT